MTIDEAIELLKKRKKEGVKFVILSHWEADQFGRKDDRTWAAIAETVEDDDWSFINASVDEMVEDAESREGLEHGQEEEDE